MAVLDDLWDETDEAAPDEGSQSPSSPPRSISAFDEQWGADSEEEQKRVARQTALAVTRRNKRAEEAARVTAVTAAPTRPERGTATVTAGPAMPVETASGRVRAPIGLEHVTPVRSAIPEEPGADEGVFARVMRGVGSKLREYAPHPEDWASRAGDDYVTRDARAKMQRIAGLTGSAMRGVGEEFEAIGGAPGKEVERAITAPFRAAATATDITGRTIGTAGDFALGMAREHPLETAALSNPVTAPVTMVGQGIESAMTTAMKLKAKLTNQSYGEPDANGVGQVPTWGDIGMEALPIAFAGLEAGPMARQINKGGSVVDRVLASHSKATAQDFAMNRRFASATERQAREQAVMPQVEREKEAAAQASADRTARRDQPRALLGPGSIITPPPESTEPGDVIRRTLDRLQYGRGEAPPLPRVETPEPSPVSGEPASEADVATYRRMRDENTFMPGRDLGSPRPQAGEDLVAFDHRVTARARILETGSASESAATDVGDFFESRAAGRTTARDKAGLLRRNLGGVETSELEAEHRQILSDLAEQEASVAHREDPRWGRVQELPTAEKMGSVRITDEERAAGAAGTRRQMEDLPTGDQAYDPDELAALRAQDAAYNKGTMGRDAKQRAADRISAELKRRGGSSPEGAANLELLAPVGGAATGAAVGATQGDTPEERRRNALLGAAAGGGLGAITARVLGRGASRDLAERGGVTRGEAGAPRPGYVGDPSYLVGSRAFPKPIPAEDLARMSATERGIAERRARPADLSGAFDKSTRSPVLKGEEQLAETGEGSTMLTGSRRAGETKAEPALKNRTGAVGNLESVGGAKSPMTRGVESKRPAVEHAAADASVPGRELTAAEKEAKAKDIYDEQIEEGSKPWEKLSKAERQRHVGALEEADYIAPVAAREGADAGKFASRLYSRTARAINDAPFEKGTAEQWAAHLKKNLPAGEREWTGLDDLLDANKGKVLTRAQVGDTFNENRIRLGEHVLGAGGPSLAETEATQVARPDADAALKRNDLLGFDTVAQARGAVIQHPDWATRWDVDEADRPAIEAYAAAARRTTNGVRPEPRYASYIEPGGTNYREHLVTLENPRSRGTPTGRYLVRHEGDMVQHAATAEEADAIIARNRDQGYADAGVAEPEMTDSGSNTYESSHWPGVKNPLVHVRMDDRVLPSGEKALFVEEIQSDWHQQGRRRGYNDAARRSAEKAVRDFGIDPETATITTLHNRGASEELIARFERDVLKKAGAVPDAPFKKTPEWAELGLKKAIDEAVKTGADRVIWTTGEQQARRYGLSKQIDELRYDPATGELDAIKDGDIVHNGKYDAKALPDVVGKDAADKLLASPLESRSIGDPEADDVTMSKEPLHRLAGVDLNVGGEGMKAFYDQMLPNVVKDYAKKMGIKIEVEHVPLGAARPLTAEEVRMHADGIANERDGGARSRQVAAVLREVAGDLEERPSADWRKVLGDDFDSMDLPAAVRREARTALESLENAGGEGAPLEPNPSFKITPELRAKVKAEGQPLGFIAPSLLAGLGGGVGGSLAIDKNDTTGEKIAKVVGGAALGVAGVKAARAAGRKAAAPAALSRAEMEARALVGETRPGASMPGIPSIGDAVQQVYAPATRGEQAATAGATVRAARGQMDRDLAMAQETLKRTMGSLQKNPIGQNLAMIHGIETGAPGRTGLAPVQKALVAPLDAERKAIQNLGTGKLDHFIENYFPHLWQDPEEAKGVLGKLFGTRPFEGSKAFLKKRTIPTTAEGMFPQGIPKNLATMSNADVLAESRAQGGLLPVSFNPVELSMIKLREMRKYRMAQEVIQDLESRGLLEPLAADKAPPPGYARIGDWAFSGKAAPEPVARLLNNYLSPGLRGNAAYDAYMAVGNTLNQVQLGLSAFHAGMTTIEQVVSQNAIGVGQLFDGKPLQAAKSFLTSPFAPFTQIRKGMQLRDAYLGKAGTLDPKMEAMAEQVANAGQRFKADFSGEATKAFTNAVKAKQYGRAGAQLFPALMERVMAPVMEHLVPLQKFGAFSELAQREVERLGEGATPDQVRGAAQKASDSIDNRFGQLVYDNLFWNKVAKDMAHASVRSVGWNWGTLRELGGGVKDMAGFVKDLVTPGETAKLSTRAQYAMALPITLGTMGAVTQYLMTGKGPETLWDYFHPQTGSMDADGNPNRVVLPSYMKDVFAYERHPVQTVTHKLNPLLSLVGDMLENKNYYGDEIRNGDDPVVTQLGQLARYAGKSMVPFVVQNMVEEKGRGESGGRRVATFAGVTPASREAVRTPAQNMMHDILARGMPERTPEEVQASQLRAELKATLKEKGQAAAIQGFRDKIASGDLTVDQAIRMLKAKDEHPLVQRFKGLTLESAEKVYAKGDQREQALWAPILTDKRVRAARANGGVLPSSRPALVIRP